VPLARNKEECLVRNLLKDGESGGLPAVVLTELPAVRILRPALIVEEGMLNACRLEKACSFGKIVKIAKEEIVVVVVV
jgi:hypothetical protein